MSVTDTFGYGIWMSQKSVPDTFGYGVWVSLLVSQARAQLVLGTVYGLSCGIIVFMVLVSALWWMRLV